MWLCSSTSALGLAEPPPLYAARAPAGRCHKHPTPRAHGGQCKCFAGWTGEFCQTKADSYCVGGCSGKGSCVDGVCHCAPPFFGVNCALFRTPEGVQRLMHPCVFPSFPDPASSLW